MQNSLGHTVLTHCRSTAWWQSEMHTQANWRTAESCGQQSRLTKYRRCSGCWISIQTNQTNWKAAVCIKLWKQLG